MKLKYYFRFIFLFSIILGAYFFCITHINWFMYDYENKVLTNKNTNNINLAKSSVIDLILNGEDLVLNVEENKSELIDSFEIPTIINNKTIINFFTSILEMNEKDVIPFLMKLAEDSNIRLINSKHFREPVISIKTDVAIIAFTKDAKNIHYNKYLEGTSCRDTNSINSINKDIDNISLNVKNLFKNLKLNIELNITSIRKAPTVEYNSSYNEVYYIEDITNKINIVYNSSCNEFYTLQIGFNK